MSVGGGPPPLDLAAIEARLDWYETPPGPGETKHYGTEAITLAGDLRALLVHVRALRAALQESQEALMNLQTWNISMHGAAPLALAGRALERAAAVLAAARDGEGDRQ